MIPFEADMGPAVTMAVSTMTCPPISEIFKVAPSKEGNLVTVMSSLSLYKPLTTWYKRTLVNIDLSGELKYELMRVWFSLLKALLEGAKTVYGPAAANADVCPEAVRAVYNVPKPKLDACIRV